VHQVRRAAHQYLADQIAHNANRAPVPLRSGRLVGTGTNGEDRKLGGCDPVDASVGVSRVRELAIRTGLNQKGLQVKKDSAYPVSNSAVFSKTFVGRGEQEVSHSVVLCR
jgi:hypothetical protein